VSFFASRDGGGPRSGRLMDLRSQCSGFMVDAVAKCVSAQVQYMAEARVVAVSGIKPRPLVAVEVLEGSPRPT